MSLLRPALSGRAALAAAAWAGTAQFFVAEALARSASTAPYRASRQFISDLGNTACGPFRYPTTGEIVEICSPRHGLVNASFVVAGLQLAGGALLTWRDRPAGRAGTGAKVGLVVGGLGWSLAGLAPENESMLVHSIGALLLLAGGNLGMLTLGAAARRGPGGPVRGTPALLAGAVGTAATVLYVSGQFLGLGAGSMERLAVYPLIVWAAGTGAGRLAAARRVGVVT